VTVTNEGGKEVQISRVSIGGSDSKDFAETDNCAGKIVQPGGTCTVSVPFAPTKAGKRSAGLAVSPQGTVSPQPVALAGTGT
jgi:hypothetical protein